MIVYPHVLEEINGRESKTAVEKSVPHLALALSNKLIS
jgi:hypothetical protein